MNAEMILFPKTFIAAEGQPPITTGNQNLVNAAAERYGE
jgi:hypothetical protein